MQIIVFAVFLIHPAYQIIEQIKRRKTRLLNASHLNHETKNIVTMQHRQFAIPFALKQNYSFFRHQNKVFCF